MNNNKFNLNGTLIRKKDFGKVTRGSIKVYADGLTEYIPFVAFRDIAKLVNSIQVDTEVTTTAHLHTSSYEKDGKKIYSTDVVLDSISNTSI